MAIIKLLHDTVSMVRFQKCINPPTSKMKKLSSIIGINSMSIPGRRIRIVIFISRNGHLKACAMSVIERREIRKKQHDFKSVHFERRMVLFLRDIKLKF